MQSALPFDDPTVIGGTETVCTGIGEDARNDPRWNSYPLKVVLAGKVGKFLNELEAKITMDNKEVISVGFGGPWVLFRLAPGKYHVPARIVNVTTESDAFVPGTGQGRIVRRYPGVGSATSARHKPAESL
jgi:hypothetical protein